LTKTKKSASQLGSRILFVPSDRVVIQIIAIGSLYLRSLATDGDQVFIPTILSEKYT
jgi:hypothetical protein